MTYVVLARKWRPQTFADLTGQQHVARTLTNAIQQDRVPHAMLFTGARGVGKTSSARILAMALNCAQGPTPTPCGVCDSCREIQTGQSVDVMEIDGASNRGINEIRELRDGVRYAPNRDRYKVYIIDEVHMLTTEAFNALLKTLEEPPRHVVFLFATTEAHKIPVTILSRCQRFDFRRIPHADIVERLAHIAQAEGLTIEADVLGIIARQAAGGMRDALSLFDQVIAFTGGDITLDRASEILGAAERRRMFDLSGALVARDVDAALSVLDDVLQFGVDVAHFANEFVGHLRDLTIVSVTDDPAPLTALTDGELAEARRQAASIDGGTLHRMFETMVSAAEDISRSAHARMRFEMTLVRLAALEPVHSFASLVSALERFAAGEALDPPASGSGPAPSGSGPAAGGSTSAPEGAAPSGGPEASAAPPSSAEPAPSSAEPAPPSSITPAPPSSAEPAPSSSVVLSPPASDVTPAEPPDAPADQPDEPVAVAAEPADAADATAAAPQPDEAAVAPQPDANEEVQDTVSPDAAAPGEADSGAVGVELSRADWRQLVETLRDEAPRDGALLATATAVASSGRVRIALPEPLVSRVAPAVLEALDAMVSERHGATPHWDIVDENELSDDERREGYHVGRDEEEEERERRRKLEAWVHQHETTRSVLRHWPGSAIQSIRASSEPRETSRA